MEDKKDKLKVKENWTKAKQEAEGMVDAIKGIIGSGQEFVTTLQKTKENLDIGIQVINSISNKEFEDIPQNDRDLLNDITGSIMKVSSSFHYMKESINTDNWLFNKRDPYLLAAQSIIGSGTSAILNIAGDHPLVFKNINEINAKFDKHANIDKDITYIELRLNQINPTIYSAFKEFIKKYNSSEDILKYRELIAARTDLFLNLIFKYSADNGIMVGGEGGSYSRIEQIRYFISNDTMEDEKTESIIQSAKIVWDELSDIDSDGNSVKYGSGSPIYYQQLFHRLVGNIAAILRLKR